MKGMFIAIGCGLGISMLAGCDRYKSSDDTQREQQEILLQEATSQVGMPSIKNFRERKLLKEILELRDQDGRVTYTYLYNEMTGKLVFLGQTVGYGIPYSSQFSNPEKLERYSRGGVYGVEVLPQADPNGLFAPSSSTATWIMMLDPSTGKVRPQYIEPTILVFTFKIPANDPRLQN